MSFFTTAVSTMSTLVVALGGGIMLLGLKVVPLLSSLITV